MKGRRASRLSGGWGGGDESFRNGRPDRGRLLEAPLATKWNFELEQQSNRADFRPDWSLNQHFTESY